MTSIYLFKAILLFILCRWPNVCTTIVRKFVENISIIFTTFILQAFTVDQLAAMTEPQLHSITDMQISFLNDDQKRVLQKNGILAAANSGKTTVMHRLSIISNYLLLVMNLAQYHW